MQTCMVGGGSYGTVRLQDLRCLAVLSAGSFPNSRSFWADLFRWKMAQVIARVMAEAVSHSDGVCKCALLQMLVVSGSFVDRCLL